MTTPGDRLKGWVDGLALAWGAQLGKWAAGFVMGGLEGIADTIGLKASEQLAPMIKRLEDAGIPPELKPIIDELKAPTGEIAALTGMGFLNRVIGSIKGDVFEYLTRSITHAFSYSADFYLADPKLLLSYYLRHIIADKDELYDKMRSHGIPPEETDKLITASQLRFPSEIVGELWLRDRAKYAKYWDDVSQLGVDQDRILALQELVWKIPSFRDVVGFLAHEVFEPKQIAKYGLDDEWGELDKTMFRTVGLKEEMALNYWRDHWQHASWSQVVEMLHRGVKMPDGSIFSEKDIYDWFRLVEIPPYWRAGLTQTMYNLPGRIEVRMMAQYGIIDKAQVMELLRKDGLAEEYLGVVADMNIVRGIRSDIQLRYTKKWLDSAGVKAEIGKFGLSPEIAERLFQWIVINTAGDRTAPEKDITAAEIIKGVKKGYLTWDEGVQQLIALGYDEVEADYKLAINVEVVETASTTELNTRVDTIRRRRRQRLISRDQQIAGFLDLGLDTGLAEAYAENDDLRLVKATTEGE